MTASEARLHLRYSSWASHKLLEAAGSLTPEDRERRVGVSHESIAGTLAHIQMADWIWSTRVVEPMERPPDTWEAVTGVWPRILEKWIAWADRATDEDLARVITYKALDGRAFQNPCWQLVLHVVNHATLHRGQIMAMIRQLGVPPPGTDLIYYYRELSK
jgi:uncharacterized damage-inducible protein DinB